MRKKECYTGTFETLQRPPSDAEKTNTYIQRSIPPASTLYEKCEREGMECISRQLITNIHHYPPRKEHSETIPFQSLYYLVFSQSF